ncbi:TIR domain-containing protein [Acinetobacter wuhouensis]|uniref:Molecular chaperone Tir n=1 Tax=Acinetobacter wuhouensis TaxID=1879050 RepID=A0A3G2T5D4_9GAMM|nr:TIR domain-containing protein [Acinetobacter wuhouensis]AYO55225.1 molecular chaperone Tir [Acinetobacter wuhouensis]RZG47777.1 molecular chaperone Tir [Acinetobacter wuhouensis]RZG74207.1 molecular chaperone Tir [Acinetobacter wuhouensis]
MGNKVFISYKYADSSVQRLITTSSWEQTTPRNYVDIIQQKVFPKYGHINKGENDGESLANFKESTIYSKLADKIFDSSITIVLISPNMKVSYPFEKDQWIPWEISYSLRTKNRQENRSNPNAILAVVLPDSFGNYDYANYYSFGFEILKLNKSNLKPAYSYGVYDNDYIVSCTWTQFLSQFDSWIEKALRNRSNVEKYNLRVNF